MDNLFVLAWVLPGFIFWLTILRGEAFQKDVDHRLLSVAALLSVIFIFIARLLVRLVFWLLTPTNQLHLRTLWHSIFPITYSASFVLSCGTAFFCGFIYRALPEAMRIKTLEGDESALTSRLWELLTKSTNGEYDALSAPLVMLQLKNNKIYIGLLVEYEVEGKPSDNFIEIIPLMSGQRTLVRDHSPECETSAYRTQLDTFYFDVDNTGKVTQRKTSEGEYVRCLIVFSQLISLTKFDLQLYETFQKDKAKTAI